MDRGSWERKWREKLNIFFVVHAGGDRMPIFLPFRFRHECQKTVPSFLYIRIFLLYGRFWQMKQVTIAYRTSKVCMLVGDHKQLFHHCNAKISRKNLFQVEVRALTCLAKYIKSLWLTWYVQFRLKGYRSATSLLKITRRMLELQSSIWPAATYGDCDVNANFAGYRTFSFYSTLA